MTDIEKLHYLLYGKRIEPFVTTPSFYRLKNKINVCTDNDTTYFKYLLYYSVPEFKSRQKKSFISLIKLFRSYNTLAEINFREELI